MVSELPRARGRADASPGRSSSAILPWLVASLCICGALGCLEATRTLAAGRPVADHFYPVGYPVLLAPSYALFGLDGVIAFQALLYAVSLWLLARLLERAGVDRQVVASRSRRWRSTPICCSTSSASMTMP